MKKSLLLTTLFTSSVFAHATQAHTQAHSVWHFLTAPDHLAMIMGMVAVMGYLAYGRKSAK